MERIEGRAADATPPYTRKGWLLDATPDGNVSSDQARGFVARVVDGASGLHRHLDEVAGYRAADLHEAHERVRGGARMTGVTYSIEPQLPADVLGVYVLLPVASP